MRLAFCLCLMLSSPAFADDALAKISAAEVAANGERVHRVQSQWQAGETLVRVLLPTQIDDSKKHRVLFVLPVEAGIEHRYGDGLDEIRQLDLHNRHRLICVAPTFSHLPWFADHPTDPTIRQESYLLRTVLPLIEERYPVRRERSGRLLLGFSKSGWGAFSLLLRNPDVFEKAAAWDAPLMMAEPGKYGSGPIFGSTENFRGYQLTELLRRQAKPLGPSPRLLHLGYDNFRTEHVGFEALLNELNVPHIYQSGPQRKHVWQSGWVEDAVRLLVDEGH